MNIYKKSFKLNFILSLFFILIIMITVFTVPVKAVESTTYYVSTNGNDSNPGTLLKPFRTIYYGMYQKLKPGDTLIIRGGTYVNETDREDVGIEISNRNGSSTAWYTVKNYPGETVMLDGNNTLVKGLGFYNSSYWHIEGIQITNYTNAGIYLRNNCKNFELHGLKIYNLNYPVYTSQGVAGILGEGATFCTVKNCNIYNIGLNLDKPKDHGIYINNSANNWTIMNNRIHDNSGAGIQLYTGAKNCIIKNNTFFNNHQWGVVIGSNSNGNEVYSNKFYGNKDSDLYLLDSSSKNIIKNNFFASFYENLNVAISDYNSIDNMFDYNYYIKSKGLPVYFNNQSMSFYKWQGYSKEANGKFSDISNIDNLIPQSGKNYTLKRLGGVDIFDTAKIISEEFNNEFVDSVVIASGLDFPDALSGSLLSKKVNAPILFSGNQDCENEKTIEYIQKHLKTNGNVFILGGPAAVSENLLKQLTSLGYNNIKRLWGAGRYDTNQKINGELNIKEGTPVIIASGNSFADALSVSSIAAIKGYPIILTDKDTLPFQSQETLINIKPSLVYIIGGDGVINKSVESKIQSLLNLDSSNLIRIWGMDRYKTSINVADYFNLNGNIVTFAYGENFPDALSGSVLAAKLNAPIILIGNNVAEQKEYLDSTDYTEEILFSTSGVINSNTEYLLKK